MKKTEKMQEFEKLFDIFCKNRKALCNEEGKIKKENIRFFLKYSALANEVAIKATEVIKEDLEYFVPEKDVPGTIKMWEQENPKFGEILKKGTLEDFYNAFKTFHDRVIDYCVTRHQE